MRGQAPYCKDFVKKPPATQIDTKKRTGSQKHSGENIGSSKLIASNHEINPLRLR
ncbi:hypothetical protein SPLC1_S310390 [Arthrospira platensis C1]|nr:hypothetical protein SPLC1_S310390 [Arthrospira platensis C1]